MLRKTLILGLVFMAAGAASAANAPNSAALALFREGRYAAAYAAFWPALERGDPEAVFHGLIIRRHGLDGRPPAQAEEAEALTALLAGRAEFMGQALAEPELPAATADAYRTALAQLLWGGQIPPARPPAASEDYPARRREEALALLEPALRRANGYPPALNFAASLNLAERPAQALALARKSAAAGDRLGMINLALFYREGWAGPKDDLKAAHWTRRAAEAEPPLARALNEVGYYYETGRGVSRDLAEARAWYARSAAQKNPAGLNNAQRLKKRAGPGRPALEANLMF